MVLLCVLMIGLLLVMVATIVAVVVATVVAALVVAGFLGLVISDNELFGSDQFPVHFLKGRRGFFCLVIADKTVALGLARGGVAHHSG